MLTRALGALALVAAVILSLPAHAQDTWPTKPIRMIVNGAAGGVTDIPGRLLAEHMREILGQPIVVESNGGGGGIVGAMQVKAAPADGYTIGHFHGASHGLLPALKKDYNLSDNPEDRGIGGASSGAICAFTVAWHRPDQFRKVLSTIGSFTNIRGGHAYPDLVRAADRKPIRVFLQDGMNDNRGKRRDGGYDPQWDWYAQNRKMVEALTSKGYDLNYTFGIGTHSNRQGGAILPEMLRWLWRDYPRPTDDPKDDTNRKLLVPKAVPADAGDGK
jgi:hypothetical protein